MNFLKSILHYLKAIIDFGLFYYSYSDFKLVGFCDSNYVGDIDDRKSIIGFIFCMGDCAISWSSKKQPIITFST